MVQYANQENPRKCMVRLYKLYNAKCPCDRPDDAFYLKPLSKPTGETWFQPWPVGHNIVGGVVKCLWTSAELQGHFTNHSLRATAATRLFEAGVDAYHSLSADNSCRSHANLNIGLVGAPPAFCFTEYSLLFCKAKYDIVYAHKVPTHKLRYMYME